MNSQEILYHGHLAMVQTYIRKWVTLKQSVLQCHWLGNYGIFFNQCFEGSQSSFPPLFSLHFHIHYAHSVGNHRFCQNGENCFPGLGAWWWWGSESTGVLQQRAFKQTLLLYTNLKYDYERMVKLQDLLIHWTNINRSQMLGIQNNLHIPYWRRHFLPLTGTGTKEQRNKDLPVPGHKGVKSRNSTERLFRGKYTLKFIITWKISSL